MSAAPTPATLAVGTPRPTGTVTFLFTDVEGSTPLLNAHPEQHRLAVRRHHDLLLEAVHLTDGAVFETVGDAVYAASPNPPMPSSPRSTPSSRSTRKTGAPPPSACASASTLARSSCRASTTSAPRSTAARG